MATKYKFREFEEYGLFISIPFQQNLDRVPAWKIKIETVEETLFESGRYFSFAVAEENAIIKATGYLLQQGIENLQQNKKIAS